MKTSQHSLLQIIFPSLLSISFHIHLMFTDFSSLLKKMSMLFIIESQARFWTHFEFLIKIWSLTGLFFTELNRFVKLQIMRRLHRLHSDKNLSQLPLDINTIYTKLLQNNQRVGTKNKQWAKCFTATRWLVAQNIAQQIGPLTLLLDLFCSVPTKMNCGQVWDKLSQAWSFWVFSFEWLASTVSIK